MYKLFPNFSLMMYAVGRLQVPPLELEQRSQLYSTGETRAQSLSPEKLTN